MTFAYRTSGSFTSAGAAAFQDVSLPHGQPDLFVLQNRTDWGANTETGLISKRYRGMAEESALLTNAGVNTNLELSASTITTNGFRFIDQSNPPVFAALAQTNISVANPAVVTMANTGAIQAGSVVRFDNTTGQLQTSGYDIEVTAVTVNTNITLTLDSQNFAAVGTAGNARLIIPPHFYPRYRYIMPIGGAVGITQAVNAVVSVTVAHDFTVGEKVSFRVPTAWGMSEINNVTGTVTAVGTYTITTDIDSSGFTAFLPPTSAVYAAGVSPAVIVPAGAGVDNVTDPTVPFVPTTAAFDSRNRFIMRCGTGVVTSVSCIYDWVAEYSEAHDISDL